MTATRSRVAGARPVDARRYLAYFGRFIRAFAGKAFSTGTAWCIDGIRGGALCLPPGVKPDEDAIAIVLDESVPRGSYWAY